MTCTGKVLASLAILGAVLGLCQPRASACSCGYSDQRMYLPEIVSATSAVVVRLRSDADVPTGWHLVSESGTVDLTLLTVAVGAEVQWLHLSPAEPLVVGTTYRLAVDDLDPTSGDVVTTEAQMRRIEVAVVSEGPPSEAHWTAAPALVDALSAPSSAACSYQISLTFTVPADSPSPLVRVDFTPYDEPETISSLLAFANEGEVWVGATECDSFRLFEPDTSYSVALSLWSGSEWVPAPSGYLDVATAPMMDIH